jgi:organic radical activating enzyme
MAFTGGEPLMKHAQEAAIEVVQEFKQMSGGFIKRMGHKLGNNLPRSITWETNGTQPLTDEFLSKFGNRGFFPNEIFFSVSPKLWTVAGEKREKAICPDVVKEYYKLADVMKGNGQLKFVVGPQKEQWEEVLEVVDLFRQAGVYWPVWIMPTGATVEEQYQDAGAVAKTAFEYGFNVSARVHTYLFGNAIGT